MNTHNDFLDNAVNDELEMECIGDLTTDACSDMQNDTEKMCLSLQNATCGECVFTTSEGKANINHSHVKLLEFRHFERFFTFSKSTEKTKPIRELA